MFWFHTCIFYRLYQELYSGNLCVLDSLRQAINTEITQFISSFSTEVSHLRLSCRIIGRKGYSTEVKKDLARWVFPSFSLGCYHDINSFHSIHFYMVGYSSLDSSTKMHNLPSVWAFISEGFCTVKI